LGAFDPPSRIQFTLRKVKNKMRKNFSRVARPAPER